MSKVVYLGYYSCGMPRRKASPAGITMMDYVIDSINNAGLELTVISPAQTEAREFVPREEKKIREHANCIFLPSVKKCHKTMIPIKLLQRIQRENNLRKELDGILEDGDTLIVYHSLNLMSAVKAVCQKKKIRLILQVCEIYTDVFEQRTRDKERIREVDFIRTADSYIFSSTLLERELNREKKRYAVCLGPYCGEKNITTKNDDGKIHVVYAGTFDPRKGGALATIAAARCLKENYHLHIIGFGSEEQVKAVRLAVETTQKCAECKITYDGCLIGEAYTRFLQRCSIGLSTQDPNAAFNNTSFPSKILSYMSNGLKVVSIRIPAVETSAIGECIYYYNNQTPKEIADAIMSIDIDSCYDTRALIDELDKQFVKELKVMLRNDTNEKKYIK